LILMSLSFILVSSISLNDAEKDIVSEVSTEVRAQIEQTVAAKSSAIAADISSVFNENYVYPYKLAKQLAASIEGKLPEPYSRGQVETMVKNSLSYSKVSSMYAQFDADQFDGKDASFATGYTHSVAGAGSLEVYFFREQGNQISQQIVDDSAEKYDETLDEFGNRAAQWYLCSKETLKPVLVTLINMKSDLVIRN